MKSKARFINTGLVIAGIQQPEGYKIKDAGQVPYLHIGKFVLSYKSLYEFTLREPNLTYIDSDGVWYRPDRHFITDRMSNPKITQCIWQESRFLGPLFHDSAYCHGGLWVSFDQGKTWKFHEMSRCEADNLLARMIIHDPYPGNYLSAGAIWAGVRLGGWLSWGKGDSRRERQGPEAQRKERHKGTEGR